MSLISHKESSGELILFEDHTEEAGGYQRESKNGVKLTANGENVTLDSYQFQIYPKEIPHHELYNIPSETLIKLIKAVGVHVVNKTQEIPIVIKPLEVANLPQPKKEEEELESGIIKAKVIELKIIDIKYGEANTTNLKIKLDSGDKIQINLKPENWKGQYPNKGSNSEIFLTSVKNLGINWFIDFDKYMINFKPSIFGKVCLFESEKKFYPGKLGKPGKSYLAWRLKDIIGLK